MILAWIDYFLDRVTMYRLLLYFLIAILLVAVGLGALGLLPYSPFALLFSTLFLLIVCAVTGWIFSVAYQAPTNVESTYLTALILACIITPSVSLDNILFLGWAGVLAIASKYILAISGKHLFNPAAIAVVITALALNQSATWWVGTSWMLPVVLLGGLLLVRKLRRSRMVLSFLITSTLVIATYSLAHGNSLSSVLSSIFLLSPILFFAFVMLTEPLTSPPTTLLQVIFGGLVGLLFAPPLHIGSLYFTPELALVSGNIFSYLVSPKIRTRLTLINRRPLAKDVLELEFQSDRPFSYQPGQYMEFTLPHAEPDSRGNRRYFTLASSPTEKSVRLGIKLYPNGSSYKKSFANLPAGSTVMAGQLAGEFTLPKDKQKKLAFLAGGIGITPYRSMLKYLLDLGERRPVSLIYMSKSREEIAYADIFRQAESSLGTKIVYTLTDVLPPDWPGRQGRIDERMITEEIPDYLERTFYISGPHPMVTSLKEALLNLNVPIRQIKTDFFPGLA